ncbi:MAG: hypothetical protein ACKVP1_09635 [Burkholderiaceae bacterium]
MKNILIVLNGKDIEHEQKMPATVENCCVCTHDPHLVDKFWVASMLNVELFNWEQCDKFPELEKWAFQKAVEVELGLDAAAREYFPRLSVKSDSPTKASVSPKPKLNGTSLIT